MRGLGAVAGGVALGLLLLGIVLHERVATKSATVSRPLHSQISSKSATVSRPSRIQHHQVTHLLSLTRYVNPLIGTAGDGNVFPGADLPHGMVQWSPDTSAGGLTRPGGYNYGDRIIRGFSLTHLSGAGCVAFGSVLFMPIVHPVTGAPQPNESPYSAGFSHAQEQASPGYYGVRLGTGIGVQLAVTTRTGIGRFTYPAGRRATLLIDLGAGAQGTSNVDGPMRAAVQIRGRNEVTGWVASGHFCGLPNTYTLYFAARFNRPFEAFGTWNGRMLRPGSRSSSNPRAGAYLTFDTARDRMMTVKVGVSFVGVGGALANLQAEDPGWSVAPIQRQAGAGWNRLLNRIQVTGGTPVQEQIFYTALYHALLQPTVFGDANRQYLGFDGGVHVARGYTQYANFSGWDIYRSEVQLLAWLMPRETSDMMQSLVADAEQGGWLPKWPVANDYTGEMNGDSADPIIAEAYAFGARSFDLRAAFGYMLRGAAQPGWGPKGYQERPGLADYLRLGYVPSETGGWGSAATTLEYAVDDFSVAQVAKALGDRVRYARYLRRAQNWRRVFNPATGFVEPRTPHGRFPSVFNPASMDGFVEGNSWQYSWMVPQNLGALFRAMGGNGKVAARLDRFFTRLNAGPEAPYYWAGNEPGLEVPWEYDFVGRPWRTQAIMRRIATSLFTPTAGGLPGNDDLGTMSAWYVWAALGLYPEIPGVGGLVLGSPLLPSITVHWDGGQTLEIRAPGASHKPYIQALRLNGRPYGRTWLPLSGIMGRAVLSFQPAGSPNTAWGTAPKDAPPSFSGP